ncbi:hypothetical protein FOZ62_023657 [Perkinsus olseni]|uniref:RRM domain-containing protein n=1 Tax=Perkinsus olseni TaxID=32597 RepID=A0A7J6U9F8_PEROL|nr:hypothetical protein FOZ62_023657 [Perkinsus olseni]
MYSRNTLYVGNISSRTTERDIRDEFSEYGRIIRCYMPPGKNICFVEYDRERDAEDAHRGMSRAKIGGVSVTVEWAKAGPRSESRSKSRSPRKHNRRSSKSDDMNDSPSKRGENSNNRSPRKEGKDDRD